MRKEITETYFIDPNDFCTTLDLIDNLREFVDWEYIGVVGYDHRLHFKRTRMETDEEMATRLRREQEAAERKRIAAQKKLDDAREKAAKAAAEYAALEAEWDSLVMVKTKAFFGVED